MQAMINLVATRQKSGSSAELLRWYNDHVNILMRFEDLQGATLYRCTAPAAAVPDYVCLYDFPSPSAFAAFEASDAKEQARQVIESGWGKHIIDILQRTQYITGGKWTGQAPSSEPLFHLQCLDMAAPANREAEDFKRWMADSLYVAAARAGVDHYQWFTSGTPEQGTRQAMVLVSASAGSAWHTWWDTASVPSLAPAPDTVSVKWQATYERVSAWRR
jgi:hypothetical protein